MHSDEAAELFLNVFKPNCVKLIKNPCIENVDVLIGVLKQRLAENFVLQPFQQYLIFPLKIILRVDINHRSENLKIKTLECLELVLQHSTISCFDDFQDLFNMLFALLSSPNNGKPEPAGSEELKLSTVSTVNSLLSSCESSVNEFLTNEKFIPPLGHAIFVLLHLSEKETNRSLQIASLNAIAKLTCEIRIRKNKTLKQKFGDLFAFFIPGISISICNLLTNDSKQGYAVIQAALKTWSVVLALVMADDQVHSADADSKPRVNKTGQSLVAIARDNEWLQNTKGKLAILIQKVCCCLVSHSNWKVKLSLLNWSKSLLFNCSKSLDNCVTNLLEVVLILSNDGYEKVSESASSILRKFSEYLDEQSRVGLVEMLEDQLYELFTHLPRLVHTGSDNQKLATLQLLCGYIRLLGSNVNRLLSSSSHLTRLTLSLVQLTEFDYSDQAILNQCPINFGYSSISDLVAYNCKKSFKHFSNEQIVVELQTLLRLLAENSDSMMLADQFLEVCYQSKSYHNQCIYLLNCLTSNLVLPVSQSSSSEEQDNSLMSHSTQIIIRQLVDEYTSERLWIDFGKVSENDEHQPLVLALQPASSNIRNLEQTKCRILQQVLLLQGLSEFSKVLGRDFRPFLITTLYLILEKVGCEYSLVSNEAYKTLTNLTSNCEYSSIGELIKSNVDYLVNTISLKLRHVRQNCTVPNVLSVVLKSCNEDIIILLQDTFNEIFFALDNHHQNHGFVFMQTLHAFVDAGSSWYPISHQETDDEEEMNVEAAVNDVKNDKLVKAAENIMRYITEYDEKNTKLDSLMEEEISADKELNVDNFADEYSDMNQSDQKVESPRHIKLVVQILKRCVHLMSSQDVRLKLLVLDVVLLGIRLMSSWQDDLLPMVHEIWTPLVERFSDAKLFVVVKAFDVLVAISEVCPDFVKSRVLKTVWKRLLEYLDKQSLVSIGKRENSSYRFTQEYKLQCKVLTKLATLAKQLAVREKELCEICKYCLPYLSSKQPATLQKIAVELYKVLSSLDTSAVWFYLSSVWSSDIPFKHDDGRFEMFSLQCSNDSQYAKNIGLLVEIITK